MKIKAILLSPFQKLWAGIWAKADPEFKKICLMAVLHAKWKNCGEDDICELERFNSQFNLCPKVSILRFPTLFGRSIWKAVANDISDELPSDRFFRRIALLTPCWLKYTEDTKAYIEDLKQLYAYCSEPTSHTA